MNTRIAFVSEALLVFAFPARGQFGDLFDRAQRTAAEQAAREAAKPMPQSPAQPTPELAAQPARGDAAPPPEA